MKTIQQKRATLRSETLRSGKRRTLACITLGAVGLALVALAFQAHATQHLKRPQVLSIPSTAKFQIKSVSGGKVAAFDSASNTTIEFNAPSTPQPQFPGQRVWIQGNRALVVVFPIEMTKTKNFGGGDHMRTEVKVSNTGRIDAETKTWTTEFARGYHGGVVVYLLDEADNVLYSTQPRRFGVNGTCCGYSDRKDVWNETASQDVVGKTRKVSILHLRMPHSSWDATVAKIKDVLQIAKTAAEIYSTLAGGSGGGGTGPGGPTGPAPGTVR